MEKGKIIAVTGGIGCGKSSVCDYLREKGYKVSDADAIARELSCESEFLCRISECFGKEFVNDGRLDRKALANYCFSDKQRTQKLNELFHGAVYARVFCEADKAFKAGDRVCFAEIPLLFETEQQDRFDDVWIVSAPENVRIDRVIKRSGLTAEEVKLRIAAQFDYSKAKGRIIDNSDSPRVLRQRVDELLENL